MIKITNCLCSDNNIIYKTMYFHDDSKSKPDIIEEIPNNLKDCFKPAILKIIFKDTYSFQELEIHKHVIENSNIMSPKIFTHFDLDATMFNHLTNFSDDIDSNYDDVNEHNFYAIIMEYVESKNLTYEVAIEHLDQICSQIEKLHKLHIIHDDIREDNFIYDGINVRLIDYSQSFSSDFKTTNKWPYIGDCDDLIFENIDSNFFDLDWNRVILLFFRLKYDVYKNFSCKNLNKDQVIEIVLNL